MEKVTHCCCSKQQSYICTYQMDEKIVRYDYCLSNFRLWQPEPTLMSMRYLTTAGLDRISYNVGPLCLGLISGLLSLTGSKHSCTLQLAFGTRTKLLHHFDISSTPSGTIICCFCSWSSSSLSGSWSSYATSLEVLGMVSCPTLPVI